jgi:hypothetical protein
VYVVKQSRGYIWISSAPGAGTTFDLYLPRVDRKAPPLVGKLEVRSQCPKGTETILALEDEESLRAVTCECLTSGGYNVLQAGRGYQASLTMSALSSTFRAHCSMHSEKSAISLSLKVLLFQP